MTSTSTYSSHTRGLLITFLVALLVVLSFYGKVFLSPNSYCLGDTSDGVKNYFTYVGYVANQPASSDFEGMNYPFGEHVMYTDGHPLLAWVLNNVNSVFPGVSNYSVGILNLLILSSFIICALLVYLILRRWKMSEWFAIAVSIGILFMQPQVFRIGAHYALSYAFFIPLTVWQLLNIADNNRRTFHLAAMFAMNVVWLWTHPYMGVISIALQLAFFAVSWTTLFAMSQKWTNRLKFAAASILPMGLFVAFIKLTDDHVNRHDDPYGFFAYYADFDTILLPNHAPLKGLVRSILPEFTQTWEGWAYLGIGPMIAMAILVFFGIRLGIRQMGPRFQSTDSGNRNMKHLFLASFILLVFSFCIPFRWNLQWLLDYVSIINQFRGIGRFAWPFYYLFVMVSMVFIERLAARKMQNGAKLKVVLALFPALMIVEGWMPQVVMSNNAKECVNIFDAELLDPHLQELISSVDSEEYQAMISVPYYHTGAENLFHKEVDLETYQITMLLSYHWDLPIMGSYLTRTSVDEAEFLWNAQGIVAYDQELKLPFSDDRPFLVVLTKGYLNETETAIVSRGTLLFDHEQVKAYSIDVKTTQ